MSSSSRRVATHLKKFRITNDETAVYAYPRSGPAIDRLELREVAPPPKHEFVVAYLKDESILRDRNGNRNQGGTKSHSLSWGCDSESIDTIHEVGIEGMNERPKLLCNSLKTSPAYSSPSLYAKRYKRTLKQVNTTYTPIIATSILVVSS
jgi:hypothetical protein